MLNKLNINPRKQKLIVYIALTVVTLAVFWQVNHYGFINLDDPVYVMENSHIQSDHGKIRHQDKADALRQFRRGGAEHSYRRSGVAGRPAVGLCPLRHRRPWSRRPRPEPAPCPAVCDLSSHPSPGESRWPPPRATASNRKLAGTCRKIDSGRRAAPRPSRHAVLPGPGGAVGSRSGA